MRWKQIDERFWVTQAGVLHAGAIKDGQTWNWWVGTVDARQDKADEYAIKQGTHTRKPGAFHDAEMAIEQIIREAGDALGLMIE